MLILITDAPPKIPDKEIESVEEAAGILRESKIDQLHLVINNPYREVYTPLQKDSPGSIFNLQDAVRGRTHSPRCFHSQSRDCPDHDGQSASDAREDRGDAAALAGCAAGCQGSGPAADSAAGLPRRRPIPGKVRRREFRPAAAGDRCLDGNDHRDDRDGPVRRAASLLEGRLVAFRRRCSKLAGGIARRPCRRSRWPAPLPRGSRRAASEAIFRILGWTLLGALAGIVLSFFVPNLRSGRSLLGGALGGAAGALGFLGVAMAIRGMPAADPSGRILGATLLGSALGLTLALAERIARKAWLEICYGGCEIRTVNLGQAPVSIGSGSAATVYARGLPPVAYRYSFAAGKVTQQDAATNDLTELLPDEPQSIGAVTVTLRTADSATAGATRPAASAQASSSPRPSTVAARPPPLRRRNPLLPFACRLCRRRAPIPRPAKQRHRRPRLQRSRRGRCLPWRPRAIPKKPAAAPANPAPAPRAGDRYPECLAGGIAFTAISICRHERWPVPVAGLPECGIRSPDGRGAGVAHIGKIGRESRQRPCRKRELLRSTAQLASPSPWHRPCLSR